MEEARYLAGKTYRTRVRSDELLLSGLRNDHRIEGLVAITEKLGRFPAESEYPQLSDLRAQAGSEARLLQLVQTKLNGPAYDLAREARRTDVAYSLATVFLDLKRFPKVLELPASIRIDAESVFGSYKQACQAATGYLLSIGQQENIKKAARASEVGKLVGEDLYVHRSALHLVPRELRLVHACAEMIVGPLEADLIKFKLKQKAVSFLYYKDFDSDPHPSLSLSIKVDLQSGKHYWRNYSTGENPPILHRKESFVAPDYPSRALFERLTQAEDKAGPRPKVS